MKILVCVVAFAFVAVGCCATQKASSISQEARGVRGIGVISATEILVEDDGEFCRVRLAAVTPRATASQVEVARAQSRLKSWVVGKQLHIAYATSSGADVPGAPRLAYVGSGRILLNAEIIRLDVAHFDAHARDVPKVYLSELQDAAIGNENVTWGNAGIPWEGEGAAAK